MCKYSYFNGDDDEVLMNAQSEMYSYMFSSIIDLIKRIYLDNIYSILYISEEEKEKIRLIENHNQNLSKSVYEIIAAIFRFKVKEGIFDRELFDQNNDTIKYLFGNIYHDTKFLENIPDNYWNISYKWYGFLIETIRNNVPLVRDLFFINIKYIEANQQGKAKSITKNLINILIDQHKQIPWIIKYSFYSSKEKDFKVIHLLYDYSEECKIGYGGIAYHTGYIIFCNEYLLIEDREIDRDHWDDSWHGNHREYQISSEKYPELIENLKEKYYIINFDMENATIKNIYQSLDSQNEKDLYGLMLSVTRKENRIVHGGELARKICEDKIMYKIDAGQSDDFYPDCDTCNYHKIEIVNG